MIRNILFVTMTDPRLTSIGWEQHTHLLWNSLKRYGTVFTLLLDSSSPVAEEMIKGDHPIFRFKPLRNRKHIGYKANIIPNSLTGLEFNIGNGKAFPSPNVVFKGVHFDLVVSRAIFPLIQYNYWGTAPVLIDIDDFPEQKFETVHSHRLSFPFRQIGRFLTRHLTRRMINMSIGGWISNESQVGLCGQNYHFLPNIPNKPTDSYVVDYQERKNLFTVGSLNYAPNREGINRFLRDIWPIFHAKYPNVKYLIVGKSNHEKDKTTWRNTDGVEYLGYVKDLERMYQEVLATVVPIYSGAGTCVKTLESMAYSRSCLSSQFGARGLPEKVIKEKMGVFIFESADSFIDAYEAILNHDYREKHESLGREVIKQHYSEENFYDAIDKVFIVAREEIDV